MAGQDDVFSRIGDDEFTRFLGKFSDRARRVEDLRREFAEIRGKGEAVDGNVVAEVFPGGTLAALEIKPQAMRLGSVELAAAIVQATGRAGEDAAEKTNGRISEAMTPLFGEAEGFTDGLRGH